MDKIRLFTHLFLFLWLAACSRYAPLTETKIKVSGIQALTAGDANITLNGLNTDGDFFQKTFHGTDVSDVELAQGLWTFYGFRVSPRGETLCGLKRVDLIAEQQSVTVEYNKNNCSREVFGNIKRFDDNSRQLKPLKIFLCDQLPGLGATGCGTSTPFDGKSAFLTIHEVSPSKINAPQMLRGGIESGCLSINNEGELVIPKAFLTVPAGHSQGLPTLTSVEFYQEEDCKGERNQVQMKKFITLDNDEFFQSEVLADHFKITYQQDLFTKKETPPPNEPTKLSKGEKCSEDNECNSSLCRQVLKNGYEKGGGTTSQTADDFELQCHATASTGACESNEDCQSGRCRENKDGSKSCLRVSVYDQDPYCTKHSDCFSGYCNFFASSTQTVGVCDNLLSDGNYLEFASSDMATIELGTNPSIDKKDSFSVSLWFKTSTTSPMMLISQRDDTVYLGSYSLSLNGAAPGFTGFTQGDSYSSAVEGSINFSLFLSQTEKHHLIAKPDNNILDNKWHHLVAVRYVNGTHQTLRIYLDGSLVKEEYFQGGAFNLNSSAKTYVGGNGRGPREFYNGGMDHLTIWNRDLTIDEISYLKDSGPHHFLLQDADINKSDVTAFIDFDSTMEVSKTTSLYVDTPNDTPVYFAADFTDELTDTEVKESYSVTPSPLTKKCNMDTDCNTLGAGYKCDWNDYVCVKEVDISCQSSDECLTKRCSNNICVTAEEGEMCFSNGDCSTNNCEYDWDKFYSVCVNKPISSLSFANFLSVGPDTTLVDVTLNDNTGNLVTIFNDSTCKSQVGASDIGGQNNVYITLSGMSAGDNSLYAIYTDKAGVDSNCYDLGSTYSVYATSDITAEGRRNEFSITSTQHSLWAGSEYPASEAIDGNMETYAHTDDVNIVVNGQKSPHWFLYEFNPRLLTKITVTSRGGYVHRFRDLDLLLLNDNNDILYQYSDISGSSFYNYSNETWQSWTIDLTNSSSSQGGIGVPVLATKLKLIRYEEQNPPGTDTLTDIVSLNIAEIKIEGYEASATNSGMFIPPPYSISFNEGASHSLEKYVVDVKGAFSNNNIFLFDNEYCQGNFIGHEYSVTGGEAQISLDGLDLSKLSSGNVKIFATVTDQVGYSSHCSSVFNIEGVFTYGLDNISSCATNTDCTQGHPQAICRANTCTLPPGSTTSDSSWCQTGSATLGICDSPPSPINGIEMHNDVSSGGSSAIIEINANNTSAFDVSLYSDSSCTSSFDQFSAPGGESGYVTRIDNIPTGENSLYYKYSQNGYTSSCTSTQANYKVYAETDFKAAYQAGNFNITPALSSVHGTHTADKALDQYPAGDTYDSSSLSHTGLNYTNDVNVGGPYWQMTFDDGEVPITYLKFWSRTVSTTPAFRFRDLNVIIYNSDDEVVYDYKSANTSGTLYRQGGWNGVPNKTLTLDLDNLNLTNGELGVPIMAKKIRLTRTYANLGTSNPDDNYVLNIQDVDVKGYDTLATDNYVSPVYSISYNQSETDTQGTPVFDIKGNFSNSDINLYADNTCSGVLVGSATGISGSTKQIVTNNFDPNDYPTGLLYFYATVRDSNGNFSQCSSLNDATDSFYNSPTQISWSSSCASSEDCLSIEENTVCRVTDGTSGGSGICAYLPGVSTDVGSLCLSYHYDTNTSDDYTCRYSAPSNGGECQDNSHCITNSCNTSDYTCNHGDNGSQCYENSDCNSYFCDSGTCADLMSEGENGASCTEDSECISFNCDNGICTEFGGGEGGGLGSLNTDIKGACPVTYTATDLGLETAPEDWNNISFSNSDGNLNIDVDTASKEVTVYFNTLTESTASIAYSYTEETTSGFSSGSGTFSLTNTSYVSGAHYITVNNFSDTSDSSYCTLRDAINSWADPTTTYGGCTQASSSGTNIIQFAPADGLTQSIVLNNSNTNEDSNASGDYDLNCSTCGDLHILGCGSSVSSISGNQEDRIFDISQNNQITLKDLSIENGNPASGMGGAIKVHSASLYLENVTFNNNKAIGVEGSDSNTGGGGGGAPGLGGAIYAESAALTLYAGVEFSNNSAEGGAGGSTDNFPATDLSTCSDLSSCPVGVGGQGARTVGYSGSYNGGSPFVNTPTDNFVGGHGGLSYYASSPSGTAHSGSHGTFGGGGGGAGNSFDFTTISGSTGSLRAGDGEESIGFETTFRNGYGGPGGAFGGAIFLYGTDFYLPSEETSMPIFNTNTIFLPAIFATTDENIFQYENSNVYQGVSQYTLPASDGHMIYNCSSSSGFNCQCENGECNDTTTP